MAAGSASVSPCQASTPPPQNLRVIRRLLENDSKKARTLEPGIDVCNDLTKTSLSSLSLEGISINSDMQRILVDSSSDAVEEPMTVPEPRPHSFSGREPSDLMKDGAEEPMLARVPPRPPRGAPPSHLHSGQNPLDLIKDGAEEPMLSLVPPRPPLGAPPSHLHSGQEPPDLMIDAAEEPMLALVPPRPPPGTPPSHLQCVQEPPDLIKDGAEEPMLALVPPRSPSGSPPPHLRCIAAEAKAIEDEPVKSRPLKRLCNVLEHVRKRPVFDGFPKVFDSLPEPEPAPAEGPVQGSSCSSVAAMPLPPFEPQLQMLEHFSRRPVFEGFAKAFDGPPEPEPAPAEGPVQGPSCSSVATMALSPPVEPQPRMLVHVSRRPVFDGFAKVFNSPPEPEPAPAQGPVQGPSRSSVAVIPLPPVEAQPQMAPPPAQRRNSFRKVYDHWQYGEKYWVTTCHPHSGEIHLGKSLTIGTWVQTECPRRCGLAVCLEMLPQGITLRIWGETQTTLPQQVNQLPISLQWPCPTCKWNMLLILRLAGQQPPACVYKLDYISRVAFVSVLYDGSPGTDMVDRYICQALVLGNRLREIRQRGGVEYDCVLLVTPDVLEKKYSEILKEFWTVKEVEYMKVADVLVRKCHARFKKVFVKLRLFELTEYTKVVFLDLDCLPRRAVGGLDEMFEFCSPRALMRGHGDQMLGRVRPASTYADEMGKPIYGINAGVMILEPSLEEFQRMRDIIARADHPSHITTSGPEQDFLTRYFIYHWRDLHARYNFQLHQLHQLQNTRLLKFEFEQDVKIAHYSTDVKPVNFLFQKQLIDIDTFSKEMLAGVARDKLPQRCAEHEQEQIRTDSTVKLAVAEWHAAWLSTLEVLRTRFNLDGSSCAICNGPHTIVECNRVADLVDVWQQKEGFDIGMDPLQALREPPPGKVAAALHFLGSVYSSLPHGE